MSDEEMPLKMDLKGEKKAKKDQEETKGPARKKAKKEGSESKSNRIF